MAGKTGTAQNPHGPPHSWFIGFAPAEAPEIVIAALVEFGHPDNQVSLAVPMAMRLIDRYLDSLYPEVPSRPRVAAPPAEPATDEGEVPPAEPTMDEGEAPPAEPATDEGEATR